MSLQGIICYYSFQTGEYLRTKYVDVVGNLKTSITQMDVEAKGGAKEYKQIFIQDREAKKTIFYKANFK